MTASLWIDASTRVRMDAASYLEFQSFANRAEKLVRRTGHPLTGAEKATLADRDDRYPHIVFDAYNPSDQAFLDSLGPVPPGGFLLSFWRGEWFEYYASWSGETSLLKTRERYWRTFGDETIIAGVLAATLLMLGLWLSRRIMRDERNKE